MNFIDDVREMQSQGFSRQKIARTLKTTEWKVRQAMERPPIFEDTYTTGGVEEPILRAALVRKLRGGWRNVNNIAAAMKCSIQTVEATIQHLGESGYMVLRDGQRARIVKEPNVAGRGWTDASPLLRNGWRKIGVIGDTHLASKYARLDVLEAAYDRFKEEDITNVYHAGNIVDGECRFNQYELLAHGVADQAMYCLDNYPQRSGITTHFITGACHEGWWMAREGIDFGRYLQFEANTQGRDDLHYLGYMEVDVKLIGPNKEFSYMRVLHPGGGSAYALSYRPQKIIESLSGGEKPAVMLVGHFHKQANFTIRNVWTVLVGCMQDQSPFMRKKSIEAHVGFSVVEMQQDKRGAVRRLRVEETGYYDRGYHEVMELPC